MPCPQLNQLPEEKISVATTRMVAQSLQAPSRSTATVSSAGGVCKYVGAAVPPGAADAAPRLDIGWYHYDKSVMQDILKGESTFDVNSARMVRKEGADSGGARGEVTVAEIMNFEGQQSKMQAARKTVQ